VRVYAFGVDPDGNPDGQKVELNGSPKYYVVPDPTATPTATAIPPTPTPTEPLPPSPHDANFYYDGDGNQVMSIVDGIATVYIGDYYEYEVGTGVSKSYYGTGVAMRVEGEAEPEANGVFFLLKDHLGSTNLTVNSIGEVASEMRYKAWGETRYATGDSITDFAYTSQRKEAGLGFYYYKARWYDPALGRFMQADTIVPEAGNPIALDRYGYVYNNPLSYIDPSGNFPWVIIPIGIMFLGGSMILSGDTRPLRPEETPSDAQGVVGSLLFFGAPVIYEFAPTILGWLGIGEKVVEEACKDFDCTNEVRTITENLCADGDCGNEINNVYKFMQGFTSKEMQIIKTTANEFTRRTGICLDRIIYWRGDYAGADAVGDAGGNIAFMDSFFSLSANEQLIVFAEEYLHTLQRVPFFGPGTAAQLEEEARIVLEFLQLVK
jgi:RHS repeat-associated protein